MYCLNCGAEMADDARFCKSCGADAMATAAQQTQAIGQSGLNDPMQSSGYAQQYGQVPMDANAGPEGNLNNPYYYGGAVDEREAKRVAKAQMKEAKAAYNDARKAAGKSNAPKIVGIIIVILIVAGLAAGGTWWFMSQNASTATSGSSSSSSEESSSSSSASSESVSSAASESASSTASSSAASASSTSASSAASASSSSAAGGLASYVGTWKGSFVEQPNYSGHHCYGAEKVPIEMTITDIGSSGRITAKLKVLYHNHGRVEQADIQSSNDDMVVELDNLVGTMNSAGEFGFGADIPGGDEIEIKFSTIDQSDGSRKLRAVVKSKYSYMGFSDVYELSKQ